MLNAIRWNEISLTLQAMAVAVLLKTERFRAMEILKVQC
jgi:hypothetical protein